MRRFSTPGRGHAIVASGERDRGLAQDRIEDGLRNAGHAQSPDTRPLAFDAHGAFIETFGHDTGRTPLVTEAELRARGLSSVVASRALTLVDLHGPDLAHVGADAALTSSADYRLCHRWSRAFHDHPRAPDGLLYCARNDPDRIYAALFDRVEPALTSAKTGTMLDPANAAQLGEILDACRYGLV